MSIEIDISTFTREINRFYLLTTSDGIPVATKCYGYQTDDGIYVTLSAASTAGEHLSYNSKAMISKLDDNPESELDQLMVRAFPVKYEKVVEDELLKIHPTLKSVSSSPLCRYFLLKPQKLVRLYPDTETLHVDEIDENIPNFAHSLLLNLQSKLKYWIRMSRAPFLTAIIGSVLIGASFAYWQTGQLNALYLVLALITAILLQVSGNILNDAFDRSTDDINELTTPFNGGSRMNQQLVATPTTTLFSGIMALLIGTYIGLYIDYRVSGSLFSTPFIDHTLLILGIIGVLLLVFYTAPPIRLSYRSMGDLIIVITFGIIPVIGIYFAITGELNFQVFLVSVIAGLYVELILWINSFPDMEADKLGGKNTLIVKLGIEKAINGYHILLISAIILQLIAIVVGILPWLSIISFLSLMLYMKIRPIVNNCREDNLHELIPALAMTVGMHVIFALLFTSSLFIAGLF